MSSRVTYDDAMLKLNQVIMERLASSRRGQRKSVALTGADFEKALTQEPAPILNEFLFELDVHIDDSGMLAAGPAPGVSLGSASQVDLCTLSPITIRKRSTGNDHISYKRQRLTLELQ